MTPFQKLSPEALEEKFRKNPQRFATDFERGMGEEGETPAGEVFWRARLGAEGLLGTKEASIDRKWLPGFSFPVAVATLIAVIVLIPYWRTDVFDPEWTLPWLALFVFWPILFWHGLDAKKERRIQSWTIAGLTLAVGSLVVWGWEVWSELPNQWSIRDFMRERPELEGDGERLLLLGQARDLMMLHWPMLILGLTGAVWTWARRGGDRVGFVRSGVQVAIYGGVIFAAGGVLYGLTLVLLDMLDVDIERTAIHLATWGLAGLIVFAHHVWLRHNHALERVLAIISRIFIPLFVLLEAGFLSIYLSKGFTVLSNDTEELFAFNLLLAAIVVLVLFYESFKANAPRLTRQLVTALIVFGVVADLIGLAAIVTRFLEWGYTPNRLAVLVGNVLFLLTLVSLLLSEVKAMQARGWPDARGVLHRALSVYVGWAAFVTLVIPAAQSWQARGVDWDTFGAPEVTIDQAVELEVPELAIPFTEPVPVD